MYTRIGLGLIIFVISGVFWVQWVNETDQNVATKKLIFAIALTVLGVFFVSSKKVKKFLLEFETKQEIETLQYEQQRQAKKAAKNGVFPENIATVSTATPESAQTLAELEKLLYTRTITDAEFQLAKDQVFLTKSTQEQNAAIDSLKKLAELHQAGILTDVEYNAAKLKALGF